MKALLLVMAMTQGSKVWTIYFQENCLPCRRQLQESDCLAERGWSLKMVGIGSDRMALLQEKKRQTKAMAAFDFWNWHEAKQRGLSGTPVNILRDISGREERWDGFFPCRD